MLHILAHFCFTTQDVENAVIQGVRSYYNLGEVVTYVCNNGYTLSSQTNTLSCNGNDKWTGTVTCTGISKFKC